MLQSVLVEEVVQWERLVGVLDTSDRKSVV